MTKFAASDEYPGLYNTDFEPVYRNPLDKRIGGTTIQFYPDHACWYEVHTHPSVNGISVFFRDVSEQRRVQEALRSSEERFRALVTASSDALYQMNPDWSEMRQLQGGRFINDTVAANKD